MLLLVSKQATGRTLHQLLPGTAAEKYSIQVATMRGSVERCEEGEREREVERENQGDIYTHTHTDIQS